MKGLNPKAWFYGFAANLDKRAAHVRRALAGSAAEQWLNMELNAYLLGEGVLPAGLYAYPESGKHDVTVFHFEDAAHHEREHREVAVIETKVVYPSYSPAKIAGQVSSLARQLLRAEQNFGVECRAVGLVLGVWSNWQNPSRPRHSRSSRKGSLSGFRRAAGEAVRDAATGMGFRAMKPALETLVPLAPVNVGPWEVDVALVGQYFMR